MTALYSLAVTGVSSCAVRFTRYVTAHTVAPPLRFCSFLVWFFINVVVLFVVGVISQRSPPCVALIPLRSGCFTRLLPVLPHTCVPHHRVYGNVLPVVRRLILRILRLAVLATHALRYARRAYLVPHAVTTRVTAHTHLYTRPHHHHLCRCSTTTALHLYTHTHFSFTRSPDVYACLHVGCYFYLPAPRSFAMPRAF